MPVLRSAFAQAVRGVPLVIVAALAMAAHAVAAQPSEVPHPALVQSGACDGLGSVVAPLADVAPLPADRTVGPASAIPVEVSVTRVDLPLLKIIDGNHAISVCGRADTYDQDIACGDVGGAIGDNGLALGLGARNGSGYSGLALLRPNGDATEVTIYLVRESGGLRASAEQAALAGTAESEAVAIKNFTFDPPAIEVPVGSSVTWTNDDNAPHTATGTNGAISQSGALPFAASFTQVFNAPGTYDYICAYHPNMKGIIVVK